MLSDVVWLDFRMVQSGECGLVDRGRPGSVSLPFNIILGMMVDVVVRVTFERCVDGEAVDRYVVHRFCTEGVV